MWKHSSRLAEGSAEAVLLSGRVPSISQLLSHIVQRWLNSWADKQTDEECFFPLCQAAEKKLF